MQKPNYINEYIEMLNESGKRCFHALQKLIYEAQPDVKETLFVHQPYYYLPMYETIKFHYRPSVMMTFFKDHVNIFAHANKKYESQLKIYKLTEKYTLQIRFDQQLQNDLLILIFRESLNHQSEQ
jgi:hypothetical protein